MRTDRALFMDLESTCWGGPPPEGQAREIIQIGLVEVDTLTLEITREVMRYVRPPTSKISPYCTGLTGITQRQVDRQGHSLPEVLNSIASKYGPKNKLCFAWGEDGETLSDGLEHYGGTHEFNFVNLGLLFQVWMGFKHAMSLPDAMASLGLKFEGRAHDALVDAHNTAILHLEMLRRFRTS